MYLPLDSVTFHLFPFLFAFFSPLYCSPLFIAGVMTLLLIAVCCCYPLLSLSLLFFIFYFLQTLFCPLFSFSPSLLFPFFFFLSFLSSLLSFCYSPHFVFVFHTIFQASHVAIVQLLLFFLPFFIHDVSPCNNLSHRRCACGFSPPFLQ